MAIAPIKRMRESWFWILAPLAIGFITPSLVIFYLKVWVGGEAKSHAFNDILDQQFAEGHNLFLLAVWSLIPFVVLGALLLILPTSYSRRRVACLSIFGLLGAMALMVPGHLTVWKPLYTGQHVSSTAVIAFIPLPFLCAFTMFVAFGVGWLVTLLPWFRSKPPNTPRSANAT